MSDDEEKHSLNSRCALQLPYYFSSFLLYMNLTWLLNAPNATTVLKYSGLQMAAKEYQ